MAPPPPPVPAPRPKLLTPPGQQTFIPRKPSNRPQSNLKRLPPVANPTESVTQTTSPPTSNVHTSADLNGQTMSATRQTPTPSSSHPSQEGARGRILAYQDLARCFHLPINTAARELGVCVTALKKQCRKHGVQRWPHRKLKSLDKLKEKLEREEATAADKDYYKHEIHSIVQKKDHIFRATPSRQKPSPSTNITTSTPNISSTLAETTHPTQNSHYSPALPQTEARPHFSYPISHDHFPLHPQHPTLLMASGMTFPQPPVPAPPSHPQPPSALLSGHLGPMSIPPSTKFPLCGIIGCDCAFNNGISSQNYHMGMPFRSAASPQTLPTNAQPAMAPSASTGFSSPSMTHPYYGVPPPGYPYGSALPYPSHPHATPLFHNMVQLNVVDQQPYAHSSPNIARPGGNDPSHPPGTQMPPPTQPFPSNADPVQAGALGANGPVRAVPQSSTGYDAYSTSGSAAVYGGAGACNTGVGAGPGNPSFVPKNIPQSPATEPPGCADGVPTANMSPRLATHYWTGGMGQPPGGGNTFTMYNQSTHFHHHHGAGEHPTPSSTGAPSRVHKSSCPDVGPTASSSATNNSAKKVAYINNDVEAGGRSKDKLEMENVGGAIGSSAEIETNGRPSSDYLSVPDQTEEDRKTETAMVGNGIKYEKLSVVESDDSGEKSDEEEDNSKKVNGAISEPSINDRDLSRHVNGRTPTQELVKESARYHSDNKRVPNGMSKKNAGVRKRKRVEECSVSDRAPQLVEESVENLNELDGTNHSSTLEMCDGEAGQSRLSNGRHVDKKRRNGTVRPSDEREKCDTFHDSSGNSGAIATIKREYTKSKGLRDETPSSDDGSICDGNDVKSRAHGNGLNGVREEHKIDASSSVARKATDKVGQSANRQKCGVVDPASPLGGAKTSVDHEVMNRHNVFKREPRGAASGTGSDGTVNACTRSRARRYEHVMMNCLGVGCAQWCTDRLLRVTLAVGTRVLLSLVGVGPVGSGAVDCAGDSSSMENKETQKRYNMALSGQKTEWIISTEKRNVLVVLAPFRKRSGGEIAGVSGIVLEVSPQIQFFSCKN